MGIFKPNIAKLSQKGNTNGLIKALKHRNEAVREAAAEALGKIGDGKGVEPLVQAMLKDDHYDVRKNSAWALGKLRDKRAVESLIQALTDWDWGVRGNAAEALGKIGDRRSVEPLILAFKHAEEAAIRDQRSLSSWDWDVVRKVAKALGDIGDTRAIELLAHALLKDEDNPVRETIAKALQKIGSKRPIEIFARALMKEDEDYHVRRNAVYALGEMGKPAVELLIDALKDKDSTIRRIAAGALDKMRWEPNSIIEKAWYLTVKEDWTTIVKLGKAAVEPAILALTNGGWDVRRDAAETLGKIGDERAIEPLIQSFRYKDSHVRESVAKALGLIGDKRAAESLVHTLDDVDTKVREASAEALAKIGDETGIIPLTKAIERYGGWRLAEALVQFGNLASKAILSAPNFRRQIQFLWILSKIEPTPDIIPDIVIWLFANPRKYVKRSKDKSNSITSPQRYLYDYKQDESSELCRAEDALKTLSPYSAINEEIMSLLIQASSFSTVWIFATETGSEEPYYRDAIEATKKLCKINNPITSALLYLISQKKNVKVRLAEFACESYEIEVSLSFTEQRKIASEELKIRSFTSYDPTVYLKK